MAGARYVCADCGARYETYDPPCQQCASDTLAELVGTDDDIDSMADVEYVCRQCGATHVRNNPPCRECGGMGLDPVEPARASGGQPVAETAIPEKPQSHPIPGNETAAQAGRGGRQQRDPQPERRQHAQTPGQHQAAGGQRRPHPQSTEPEPDTDGSKSITVPILAAYGAALWILINALGAIAEGVVLSLVAFVIGAVIAAPVTRRWLEDEFDIEISAAAAAVLYVGLLFGGNFYFLYVT